MMFHFLGHFGPFLGTYDFSNFSWSSQILDQGQITKIKYLICDFCMQILMWEGKKTQKWLFWAILSRKNGL